MAHLIVIIVSLIMSISCYFMKRQNKLILILISCLIFNSFNFSSYSFTSLQKLLCIIYIFSELKYFPYYIKRLRSAKLLKCMVIVIIGAIITIITSPNINSINTLLGFLVNELIAKYFVVAYAFISLKNISSINRIYNITFWCLIFMTFVGIINYIFKQPLWNNFFTNLNSGDAIMLKPYEGERFRVTSTFYYSFDYGQACVMILIFTLYQNSMHALKRTNFYTAILCCLFGILFCGCRTVLATFIIAIGVYVILYYRFSRGMGIALATILAGLTSYLLIPAVNDKVNLLASAFDSESKVAGSSSSMRLGQYGAVISIVKDDILFGKGFNFFINEVGWDGHIYSLPKKYRDLYGLEGALMALLLERGIVGVAVYIIFYIGLIRSILKYRRNARSDVAAAVAIIISFIAFGNMTGELFSSIPTFIFSGILLKSAFLKSKYNSIFNKLNPEKLSSKHPISKCIVYQ